MNLLADFLGSIALTLTLCFFYEHFLQKKKRSRWAVRFLYLSDCLLCLASTAFAPFPLQRACCFAAFVSLPLCLYSNKDSFKFALAAMFCATVGLTEVTAKAILLGHSGSLERFCQGYARYYPLGTALSRAIAFVLIYCYTVFGRGREATVPRYLYCFLLAVPVISLLLYYFIQAIVYTANRPSVYLAHCYVTLTLLSLNIVTIFLFYRASEASWFRAKLTYERQIFDRQKQYHQNLAGYHQSVQQLYHDMQHHFLILYQALSEQDTATAMQYLQTQLDYLRTDRTTYSSYLLLDTILDYKGQAALRQHTAYTVQSQLEPALPLGETFLTDLSIMLASCIDNALEATAQIAEPRQRWIKIRLHNDAAYIYLHLENAVHQHVDIGSARLPPTTKADPRMHGLGLRTVDKLVRKYDGALLLECDDCMFTAALMVKY